MRKPIVDFRERWFRLVDQKHLEEPWKTVEQIREEQNGSPEYLIYSEALFKCFEEPPPMSRARWWFLAVLFLFCRYVLGGVVFITLWILTGLALCWLAG